MDIQYSLLIQVCILSLMTILLIAETWYFRREIENNTTPPPKVTFIVPDMSTDFFLIQVYTRHNPKPTILSYGELKII